MTGSILSADLGWAAAAVATGLSPSVVEVRPADGRGAGAGTIWRADGLIVTNHHVAAVDEAEVRLADGRRFAGRVVARDPRNDLAVVRIPVEGLPAAPRGDARALRPGDLVLAIGHPFGLRGSVTVGVVSSLGPAVEPGPERELIRADLLLGPGNSGGPLANARGEVVGLNAMVAGGLALAVPTHLAKRLIAPDRAAGVSADRAA